MNQTRERSGWLAAAIATLTLFAAGAHLYLGIRGLERPLNVLTVLFLLNGLGYLALLAALYVPTHPWRGYHHSVRQVLMGFAALTLVAWGITVVAFHIGRIPLAYVTDVDEMLLIALLWLSDRQSAWRVHTEAPPQRMT